MGYVFKNQQEKDEAIAEVQALRDMLKERQYKTDKLAIEMARKAHPHVDWLELTAQQRDYYWSEAGSRIFWQERQDRLNRHE